MQETSHFASYTLEELRAWKKLDAKAKEGLIWSIHLWETF